MQGKKQDDLEMVTGGKALPVQEKWLAWPESGKDGPER